MHRSVPPTPLVPMSCRIGVELWLIFEAIVFGGVAGLLQEEGSDFLSSLNVFQLTKIE